MLKTLRQSVMALVVLGVITGVVYPLAVTGVSQAFFPHEAGGSMIVQDGKIVGSELIGQPFSDSRLLLVSPLGDGAGSHTMRQLPPAPT